MTLSPPLSVLAPTPTPTAAREPAAFGHAGREAAAQARQDERLKESRAALETLKQISTPKAQADERKAAALKKVAQIKEQIRSLQMTATLDPEGTARLAARLARELGQAVKAYASAGGSAADLGLSAPAALEASPRSENAVATQGAADAPPVPTDGPPPSAPAPAPSTGPTSRNENGATQRPNDETDKASPRDPYRQAVAAIEARGTEQASRAVEARGNAEFVAEVKRLAAELKSLIRGAARQLEARGDPGSKEQGEAAEKAVKQLDREIAEAERSLSGGGGAGVSLLI